jgi:hypothetical protein
MLILSIRDSRKVKLFESALRIFGEMGVVTTKDDIKGKLKNSGLTYMFVVYSVDHAKDAYRMLNLNSKRIIQTSDAVSLGKG